MSIENRLSLQFRISLTRGWGLPQILAKSFWL